jgi:predicted AlkP superfamily pyrophosphatase or phosphodiesterase
MLSAFALVVVIVIDQFRTDEYLRLQNQLSPNGIVRLIDQGIFYDDAHHTQFFNMTCPGHVAISTGFRRGLNPVLAEL